MFVETFFTLLSIIGLAIYYWEDGKQAREAFKRNIYVKQRRVKVSKRIKRGEAKRTVSISGTTGDDFIETVRRMLQVTMGFKSRKAVYGLIAISAVSGVLTFMLLRIRIPVFLAYFASIFTFSIPILMLLCRLQTIRIENSKEGDIMVTDLIDNYKMNYFNMHQAIEVTAITIKEAPNSRKLLFNLSKGLNTASGGEEIRQLLKDFRFAIGTSWSGVMADNMYFALVSGIRVTDAMEDLKRTIEKARKVEEFSRRENNEGRLILKYMAPGCYLLTIAAAVNYFGLSLKEFLAYQFMTEAGMVWFTIALLTYGAGIVAKIFLSKNKLDI